jgi:hypothetical protein
MKPRIIAPSNSWSTPQYFYDILVEKHGEMYDVCPIAEAIAPENDALILPWRDNNFVNPPYSKIEKEAFVTKALAEWQINGNKSVLLLPVSTSTRLYHHIIKPFASEIEFIEGRIKFEGIGKIKINGVLQTAHINPGIGINIIPNSKHLPKAKNSGTFDSFVITFGHQL